MATPSPTSIPLPLSPSFSRRPSVSSTSRRSSAVSSSRSQPAPAVSPRTLLRPRLDRNQTITSLRQEEADPFHEGSTITVSQPVGSLSISPSSRDICLASRKGLYILDLANLNNAPRFIPQGGTWQIAEYVCPFTRANTQLSMVAACLDFQLDFVDLVPETVNLGFGRSKVSSPINRCPLKSYNRYQLACSKSESDGYSRDGCWYKRLGSSNKRYPFYETLRLGCGWDAS